MINYLKSEYYRLLRKNGVHVVSIIWLLLITAACAILYLSSQSDPGFRYGTSAFFYSNVIAMGLLIVIIGVIYNSALTGKDMSVVKQAISFGISRQTIFWSKLILTLGYFIFICIVGILLMIVLGETFLVTDGQSVRNFLIACVNMAPLVLGGFLLTHALKMLRVGEIYILIVLLFLFGFSSNLVRVVFRPISGLNELYKYVPDTLLNDNLGDYLDGTVQFGYEYWLVGIIISVVALLIGAKGFEKQSIDG